MKKKPQKPVTEIETFQRQLSEFADKIGVARCAKACGVTVRSIHNWRKDASKTSIALRVGVVAILNKENLN